MALCRVGHVSFKYLTGKAAYKAALVVRDDLAEVVTEEFQFEVRQIETAVIIRRKLICNVQNDFICVSTGHECVCHSTADFEDLLVRLDQFVEAEGSV